MFQKILPYLIFLVVAFALAGGVIFALQSIPNRHVECEKAGGIMVQGHCIKKDAVIKV